MADGARWIAGGSATAIPAPVVYLDGLSASGVTVQACISVPSTDQPEVCRDLPLGLGGGAVPELGYTVDPAQPLRIRYTVASAGGLIGFRCDVFVIVVDREPPTLECPSPPVVAGFTAPGDEAATLVYRGHHEVDDGLGKCGVLTALAVGSGFCPTTEAELKLMPGCTQVEYGELCEAYAICGGAVVNNCVFFSLEDGLATRFNVYRKSAAPSPPPAPPLPGLIDLWAPIAADNMNSRGAPSPLAIQVYGPTGTMLGGSGSSEMSLETGLHPFNFVAADETGNEAECSVDIFVVACPSAVVLKADPGSTTRTTDIALQLIQPAARARISNSTELALLSTHQGLHAYPLGTTEVVFTITPSGRRRRHGSGPKHIASTCTVSVTVVDSTPPSVTCPPETELVFVAERNGHSATVTVPAAAVSDNMDPYPTTSILIAKALTDGASQCGALHVVAAGGDADEGAEVCESGSDCESGVCGYGGRCCRFGVSFSGFQDCLKADYGSFCTDTRGLCRPNPEEGDVTFSRSTGGKFCSQFATNVLKSDFETVASCEQYCATSDECTVCSVACNAPAEGTVRQCHWRALPECGAELATNGGPWGNTGGISYKQSPDNRAADSNPSQCAAFGVYYKLPKQVQDLEWINQPRTPSGGAVMVLEIGRHMVKYSAVDSTGLVGSCVAIVRVEDREPPVIQCPRLEDEYLTDPGVGFRRLTLPPASASDNHALGMPTVLRSKVTTFALGTTPIEFIATDASGLSATCTVAVTVVDREAPMQVCPQPATRYLFTYPGFDYGKMSYGSNGPGAMFVHPELVRPTVIDNAGDTDTRVVATRENGSGGISDPLELELPSEPTFEIGDTYISFRAVDGAGNTGPADCVVHIHVLKCPARMIVAADPGMPYATKALRLEDFTETELPARAYNHVLTTSHTGEQFPLGATQVTAYVKIGPTDDFSSTTTTCTFTVYVRDFTPPKITCPAPTTRVLFAADESGTAQLRYTGVRRKASDLLVPDILPIAVASDSGHPRAPAMTASIGSAGTYRFEFGPHIVTFTASDSLDNRASCNVTVIVMRCPAFYYYRLEPDAAQALLDVESLQYAGIVWRLFGLPVTGDTAGVGVCGALTAVSAKNCPADPEALPACHRAQYGELCLASPQTECGVSRALDNCKFRSESGSPAYELQTSGGCPHGTAYIETREECNAAAVQLGLADTTAGDAALSSDYRNPYGCYFKTSQATLWFNPNGVRNDNDFDRISICRAGYNGTYDVYYKTQDPMTAFKTPAVAPGVFLSDLQLSSTHPGYQNYPVGTHPLTFQVHGIDFDGTPTVGAEPATCSTNLVVSDVTPPTIYCADSEFKVRLSGVSTANVILPVPQVSDSVDRPEQITITTALVHPNTARPVLIPFLAPHEFRVGRHKVLYTATDRANNEATCLATVTVIDDERPTIACPTLAASYATDPGVGYRTLDLPPAIAADNDALQGDRLVQPATNQSTFPIGVSQVQYVAVDNSGLNRSCQVAIKVVDAEAPIFTCPAPMSTRPSGQLFFTKPGETTVLLPFMRAISEAGQTVLAHPVVTDNAGVDQLVFRASSGPTGGLHRFRSGSTEVEFTAIDAAGHSSDPCNETVHVLSCPSELRVSTDPGVNTKSFPRADELVADMQAFSGVSRLLVATFSIQPIQFPVTLGISSTLLQMNMTSPRMTVPAKCEFLLAIVDEEPPAFDCEQFASVSAELIFEADENYPTLTLGPGTTVPLPAPENIYDNDVDGLVTVAATIHGQPFGSIKLPARPANGSKSANTVIPFDGRGLRELVRLPLGEHTLEYTATDRSGNKASCQVQLAVVDREPPRISCPDAGTTGPTRYETDPASSFKSLLLSIPETSDNDQVTSLVSTAAVVDNDELGVRGKLAKFEVGTHTVTYTAADPTGNTAACAVEFTVIDAESPTIECSPEHAVEVVGPQCLGQAMVEPPTAVDNVGVVKLSANAANPVLYNGTLIDPEAGLSVEFYAEDAAGNTATCTSVVRGVDRTPPVIEVTELESSQAVETHDCIDGEQIRVKIPGAATTTRVDVALEAVSAIDSCDGAVSIGWTAFTNSSDPSGADHVLSIGVTAVNLTAVDRAGNVQSCRIEVNVVQMKEVTSSDDSENEDEWWVWLLIVGLILLVLVVLVILAISCKKKTGESTRHGSYTVSHPGSEPYTAGPTVGATHITRSHYASSERSVSQGSADDSHVLPVQMQPIEGDVEMPEVQQLIDGIKITCLTPRAQIWYSWNGRPIPPVESVPAENRPAMRHEMLISGEDTMLAKQGEVIPFPPASFSDAGATLSVVATRIGMHPSSAIFVDVQSPAVERPKLTYNQHAAGARISISCPTAGVRMFYSWNAVPLPPAQVRAPHGPHVRQIKLRKTEVGFGFQLSSGRMTEHYVSSVDNNGPASGFVFPYDIVLAVNNASTVHLPHHELVDLIKKGPSVTLEVQRGERRLISQEFRSVLLTRHSLAHQFGFSVARQSGPQSSVGVEIVVSHVATTASIAPSRAMVNDQILAVNGQRVDGLDHAEVFKLINEHATRVVLMVSRVEADGAHRVLELTHARSGHNAFFGFRLESSADGRVIITAFSDVSQPGQPSITSVQQQLRPLDVITMVNGEPCAELSQAEVLEKVNQYLIVSLGIKRNGEDKIVTLTRAEADAGFGFEISPVATDQTATPHVVTKVNEALWLPGSQKHPTYGGSPPVPIAAAAGLQVGDVVLAINGVVTDGRSIEEVEYTMAQTLTLTIDVERRSHEVVPVAMSDDGVNEVLPTGTKELHTSSLDIPEPAEYGEAPVLSVVAIRDGMRHSAVASLKVAVPRLERPEILFADGLAVVRSSTLGAKVIYELIQNSSDARVAPKYSRGEDNSEFGAKITLDMSRPSKNMLQAYVVKSGWLQSPLAEVALTVSASEPPLFEFDEAEEAVAISASEDDAMLFYEWIESSNFREGTKTLSNPIESQTNVIKVAVPQDEADRILLAMAHAPGRCRSTIVSWTPPVPQVATPEIKPTQSDIDPGILLSCTTKGADLVYKWNAMPAPAEIDTQGEASDSTIATCRYHPGTTISTKNLRNKEMLYVVATLRGHRDSEVATFQLDKKKVATPQIYTAFGPAQTSRIGSTVMGEDTEIYEVNLSRSAFESPETVHPNSIISVKSPTTGSTVMVDNGGHVEELAVCPLDLSKPATMSIEAYAFKPGMEDSKPVVYKVTIEAAEQPTVTFEPATEEIAVTSPTPGARFAYSISAPKPKSDIPDSTWPSRQWREYDPRVDPTLKLPGGVVAWAGGELLIRSVCAGMAPSPIVEFVIPSPQQPAPQMERRRSSHWAQGDKYGGVWNRASADQNAKGAGHFNGGKTSELQSAGDGKFLLANTLRKTGLTRV